MKYVITTILSAFTALMCFGQLYDATYVAGDVPLSFINMDSPPGIDSVNYQNILFTLTVANICDEYGNLLYITNGIKIFDKNADTIENGTGLNPCSYTTEYECCGLNIQQATIFIPQPGNKQYYYLFHFSNDDTANSGPETLFYSVIDRNGNGGLGTVIQKNVPILQQTPLREGGMAACKHGNGRDYWLVMGASVINTFYKFLITPAGVQGPFEQSIGPEFPLPFDNAYSRFSQDGSKYVTGVIEGPVLVMDFDRCSGEFSNPISIFNQACHPPNSSCSGSSSVEISPNNRFIYVCDRLNLNQYDLWAANIQDSAVQIYAIDSTQIAEMDMLELAPNGKIYLSSWNGLVTFDSLHEINTPDGKGASCNFTYASQPTYSHNNIVPNMANYRLGALPGPCDTISGVQEPINEKQDVRVYPNPASQVINLAFKVNTANAVEFELTDELGQPVIQQILGGSQTFEQFSTENISNGLYYWTLEDENRIIKTGIVAIMK